MQPAVEPFVETVRSVHLQAPTIPFISNVSGTWVEAKQSMKLYSDQESPVIGPLPRAAAPRSIAANLSICAQARLAFGWDHVATDLECRMVPGTHMTMVVAPYVREVARTLSTVLAEAHSQNEQPQALTMV